MNLNKPIGGYFELELNANEATYHNNAIKLNSGRNAFEYILIHKKYKKVYIPFYTCDVILQPLKRCGVAYEFYRINQDFSPRLKSISKDEAILYVNYFGLLGESILELRERYSNIIVDNSQAYYDFPLKSTPTFYSPRKFFGLPDGGFAFVDGKPSVKLTKDFSAHRISHLITRIEKGAEAGYSEFKENDSTLDNMPIRIMSSLTDGLINNINFDKIKSQRLNNFSILHKSLSKTNELSYIIDQFDFICPMVYPYLSNGNLLLREKLIDDKIFVATYWPNVSEWLEDKSSFEVYLQNNLIPLPIDQRYGELEMRHIIQRIKELS